MVDAPKKTTAEAVVSNSLLERLGPRAAFCIMLTRLYSFSGNWCFPPMPCIGGNAPRWSFAHTLVGPSFARYRNTIKGEIPIHKPILESIVSCEIAKSFLLPLPEPPQVWLPPRMLLP